MRLSINVRRGRTQPALSCGSQEREIPLTPAHRKLLADRGACMECGACARNCKREAIRVRAGVGCAAGVLAGRLAGTGPNCDCSKDSAACC